MAFSRRNFVNALSAIFISIATSGCATDRMIRINSVSTIKLVPETEIRYRACGDAPDSCQEILQKIDSEKIRLSALAKDNYEKYKLQAYTNTSTSFSQCRGYYAKWDAANNEFDRNDVKRADRERTECIERWQTNNRARMTQLNNMSRYGFDPDVEDMKKIIKTIANTNLNEYTFSKADGSIVVICPTRYCAIANADGSWIGIAERGNPNQLSSIKTP